MVLAVPIIRDGSVKGVACLEFSSDKLKQYLNDTDLSRYGANMIFQKNGEILISCAAWRDIRISLFEMLRTSKIWAWTDICRDGSWY